LASFVVAVCFIGCSSGKVTNTGSTTEPAVGPHAEALAAAASARSPHVPGENGEQFLAKATPAERDRFFDQMRQEVTLHPPKPDDTQLDFYVCEAYIGTYQFLFDPKLSDGGCKYPSAQYFPHADAGPGGCGEYVTEPSLVFWVPIMNIHGTAPSTVEACAGGQYSDGGLAAGLANFWVQLPVPRNIGGDMIAAVQQEGFPFPNADWNGSVTNFILTSSMTSGASDAGSGFVQAQDIGQLYAEEFGGTGIPIPTQYVDGGNNLSISMPQSGGVVTPAVLPIFSSGNVIGDTMTYWAGTITATAVLDPNEFGAEAPTTQVVCSPIGNVTGWNEKPISTSTIVTPTPLPDGGSPCSGGAFCPAASELQPLGAPLESCAANHCCNQLSACVADNSSLSGCAAYASCFVNCETTVVGTLIALGETQTQAATNSQDYIFECQDYCFTDGHSAGDVNQGCSPIVGGNPTGDSFTLPSPGGSFPAIPVGPGSAVANSLGGCLGTTQNGQGLLQTSLGCVESFNCLNGGT
jgi:hypothetical protein